MKLRICVLAPLLAAAGCSDGDDVTFQPPPVQVTPACKQQCLASTGSNICIQGRAYVGAMLANKGPTSAATIKDATVNIFDLMSL